MPIFPKRPEDFLEDCLRWIFHEGKSIEECVADAPRHTAGLEPLLRTAARLNSAPGIFPSQEFQAVAVQRLRTKAFDVQQRRSKAWLPAFTISTRQRGSQIPSHRLIPLLAGGILAIMILTWISAAVVSAQAIPGDFLYSVKRAQETISLGLTLDEAGQADLNLQYASRRIDEAVTSCSQKRIEACDQALSSYDQQIQLELDYLTGKSAISTENREALASRVIEDLGKHEAILAGLYQGAPPKSQPALEKALANSQRSRSVLVNQFNFLTAGSTSPMETPTPTPSAIPTKMPIPSATGSSGIKPAPIDPSAAPTSLQVTRPPAITMPPTSTPSVIKPQPSPGIPSPTPTKPPAVIVPTTKPTLPSTSNPTATVPPNISTAPVTSDTRITPTMIIKP